MLLEQAATSIRRLRLVLDPVRQRRLHDRVRSVSLLRCVVAKASTGNRA